MSRPPIRELDTYVLTFVNTSAGIRTEHRAMCVPETLLDLADFRAEAARVLAEMERVLRTRESWLLAREEGEGGVPF
jgi:hypothetical protein